MPSSKKILFDCERMKHAHTGLYHFCYHLGRNLVKTRNGNEICFYAPSSINKMFGEDACYLRQNSLQKFLLPSTAAYDIWHSTYQGTSYFPSNRELKIVLTVHDLNFLYDETKPQSRKNYYLKQHAKKIKRADAIVAISSFVKNDILKYFDVPEDKIHVIYNGCNIVADVVPDGSAFNFDEPFLFSIGTIAKKKNFDVLPGALVNNTYHLVIAGIDQDQNYLQKIFESAEKLGVRHRLHYIGAVTEPQKYWLLQNCSLFVFPSLSEGFGLPVIEAMHFGKPVLLSQATSLPEIGGPFAEYLSSFETTHVSDKTLQAINSFSEEKSKQIKAWAAKFNWHNAAEQYWKVYETVMNG